MAFHQVQKGTRETRDDDTTGRRHGRPDDAREQPVLPLDIAVDSGGAADAATGDLPTGLESPGERRLARLLAPLGRQVRPMRYLGKWVALGAVIGAVAGLGAIVFYEAIVEATRLFQGAIVGCKIPKLVRRSQA